MQLILYVASSNNTNKLSPQELNHVFTFINISSNNTNKLSPQEPTKREWFFLCSNNTNKLSPQEPMGFLSL